MSESDDLKLEEVQSGYCCIFLQRSHAHESWPHGLCSTAGLCSLQTLRVPGREILGQPRRAQLLGLEPLPLLGLRATDAAIWWPA